MKKFLVVYHAPASAMAQMANVSDEDKAKGMQAWMSWKAQHDNNILDFGAPLMGGQSLSQDGNWSGSAKEVSGYSIVQGEDADSVKAMFNSHPHLGWAPGVSIEVHEAVEM